MPPESDELISKPPLKRSELAAIKIKASGNVDAVKGEIEDKIGNL